MLAERMRQAAPCSQATALVIGQGAASKRKGAASKRKGAASKRRHRSEGASALQVVHVVAAAAQATIMERSV